MHSLFSGLTWRRSMAWLTVVFVSMHGSLVAVAQTDDVASLSNKLRRDLDQVIFPAMKQGDAETFYDAFGPILINKDSDTVERIESYASASGLDSPLDYMIELKLMRIEQGIDSAHEKLAMKPTMLMLAGINRTVTDFLQTVSDHALMQDPITVPDDWKSGRDLFWSSHVLKNEFSNYEKALLYGSELLATVRPRLKNADARDREQVEQFVELLNRFPIASNDLHEAEAVARLMRFERSADQMIVSKDFRDRLIAAMSIELDSEFLIPFLTSRSSFSRSELNNAAEVLESVQDKVGEFRTSNSTLLRQASLFRSGSHWWLRGRYGRGALADGLLKTKDAVEKSAAMNALYMPRERPIPEDNFIGTASSDTTKPYYKRRHYYTWALEYRPLLSDRSRDVKRRRIPSLEQSIQDESSDVSKQTFFY